MTIGAASCKMLLVLPIKAYISVLLKLEESQTMKKKIDPSVKGMIFNIQRYSIHDGPGIRTTVFLKGCPLRCIWCQNPESHLNKPQIFYNSDTCTGCGKCVSVCPKKAVDTQGGKVKTDRAICDGCGTCVDVCPTESRILMGKGVTAEYVFREVKKDKIFYENSGGGVTLSGGEPLMQPKFAASILSLCKEDGIHTAIDTSGYATWEVIKEVFEYVDLVLFDFKEIDSRRHESITGVPNALILENAKRICREFRIPFFARIPVIPTCNDSIENMEAIAKFISNELGRQVRVFLLPYHRLGEVKYLRLEVTGRTFSTDTPSEEHMEQIKRIFESYGLDTQVGG